MLFQAGLKKQICEDCGLSEWREQSLPLQLHHISGIRDDNRVENLKILCPNCHSITDNYAGRSNRRDGKVAESG